MNPPKVAACLITKDSENTLSMALASIRPHVDGIFIYDTGSTDGTFEMIDRLNAEEGPLVCAACGTPALDVTEVTTAEEPIRQCGCHAPDDPENRPDLVRVPLAPIIVERGEWRDDFAWARKQSFAMPPDEFEWLLWLDDDDEIQGAHQLRAMAATAPPELDGYIAHYDYARTPDGTPICVLWRERLIRRSAGYRWRNPIHEVLVAPDGHAPNLIALPRDQLNYVHHRPPDRYTPDRNLDILRKAAQEEEAEHGQPTPRTLAYLGTEIMGRDPAEAAAWFQRYLAHPEAIWGDERAQCHHKLATCLRALGNPLAAVEVEMASLKERDDWAETFVGLSQSYAQLGDWPKAERWAKRMLPVGMPHSPLILNPLEFTFVPMTLIAEACANTGRAGEALEWMRKAAELVPGDPNVQGRIRELEDAQVTEEIVAAILKLREWAVRLDENQKALELLERAVPYVVQDHPAIVQARAAQRENCRHLLEPDEYRRWYSEEPKESTVVDEWVPRAAEAFHRVAFMEAGLEEQELALGRKPTVLDLGCNDFWVGAYLTGQGYPVDGVELNRRSFELALERADRFARNGDRPTIVHGDLHEADRLLEGRRYDAVSLFEVIEHVPDPEATLAVCESLLNPGGRVYVSTPDGAFERGNLPRWSVVERKGHLRAWPAVELAERVCRRGSVHEMGFGQGLSVIAYEPGPKRGKVIFYAGGAFEPWSPLQIHEKGLGGSETALAQVAVRLARRGFEVKVYADVEPGLVGGVVWKHHSGWDPSEPCDAMVVSRIPPAFDLTMKAPVRALWCHDHSYPGLMTEPRAENMTDVLVLSEWERDRFATLYPYLDGKLRLIRNGVTVTVDGQERFPDRGRPFADRKPRCVYSSSADRGLDVLLELWPRVRARVPDAELHVYYGWDVYDRVALRDPGMLAYKAHVLDLAAKAGGEDGGVYLRGRVGQGQLYQEMQDARVWAYPTAFLETSCIGAMEARCAGLAMVTSNLGALRETVGEHGVRIAWSGDESEPVNRSDAYQDAFVRHVCKLLGNEETWDEWHAAAATDVEALDWEHRVDEWERMIVPALATPKNGRKPRKRKEPVAA